MIWRGALSEKEALVQQLLRSNLMLAMRMLVLFTPIGCESDDAIQQLAKTDVVADRGIAFPEGSQEPVLEVNNQETGGCLCVDTPSDLASAIHAIDINPAHHVLGNAHSISSGGSPSAGPLLSDHY